MKEHSIAYSISNKKEPISFEVKLPERATKVKGYAFSVLTNHLGEYLVVFAGGSDYGADEGENAIFGYVIVKERMNAE